MATAKGEIMDINEIKASLAQFNPKDLTTELISANKGLLAADMQSKTIYAKKFLYYKEQVEKITDSKAENQTLSDAEYISIEAQRIVAKGKLIEAQLLRDDYYAMNDNVKKLAGIEEKIASEIGG
jgi:hypothetical protein